MKLIGEKIREIRQSKGISQTVVAESCGIKQSSYANIENGKTQNITIEIGKGIAKALGMSFNELFDIDLLISDYAIKMLEDENNRLQKESERLQKQIEDYQLLVTLLKNKNMITVPREEIKEENKFEPAGDEFLKQAIEKMDEKDKEILSVILNNPELKESCEAGTMKDESIKRVWKEYLENK